MMRSPDFTPSVSENPAVVVSDSMSDSTPARPNDVIHEFTLPSGIRVTFHKRTGRALINAQRKVGRDTSMLSTALISEIARFNDKTMLMEDIIEMDLFDTLALNETFGEFQQGKGGQTARR